MQTQNLCFDPPVYLDVLVKAAAERFQVPQINFFRYCVYLGRRYNQQTLKIALKAGRAMAKPWPGKQGWYYVPKKKKTVTLNESEKLSLLKHARRIGHKLSPVVSSYLELGLVEILSLGYEAYLRGDDSEFAIRLKALFFHLLVCSQLDALDDKYNVYAYLEAIKLDTIARVTPRGTLQ